jgi:ankyrin repeat protein
MIAARNKNNDTVVLLLEAGANANLADKDGLTALHHAVANTLASTSHSLGKDEDPSGAATNDMQPLQSECERDAVVKSLVSFAADSHVRTLQGWTSLHYAAANGYTSTARILLEHLGKNTALGCLRMRTKDDMVPLHYAVANSHDTTVQLLLEWHCSALGVLETGYTPLHLAAHEGFESLARLVLDHGADPNETDNTGRTPLDTAARNCHETIVQLLLERGVDPNATNDYGGTPLHSAAQGGHEPIVRLLLDRCTNPCNYGWTPLHCAAARGHEPIVRLLLEHGVGSIVAGYEDGTPLYMAARNGHESTVRLLLDQDLNPNATENSGQKLLRWVKFQPDHAPIVWLLRKCGVNPTAVEKNQWPGTVVVGGSAGS